MELRDEELVQRHVGEDPELRTLWEQHLQYEKKLEKIERKQFLNEAEKAERKRLQVAKLNGRTRIEAILNKYRGPAN